MQIPAWLNFVVTSKARSGIRSRLRNQKNSSARKAGKLMLESELKRSGKSLRIIGGALLKRVLDSIGVTTLNKLLTILAQAKELEILLLKGFIRGCKLEKKNELLKIGRFLLLIIILKVFQ